MKALDLVKATWDGPESDDEIAAYLDIAGAAIVERAYPYDEAADSVPERYSALQAEIAKYLMGKKGAEGQTTHTENGVSRGWGSADIPEAFLSRVVPRVGVL